jgi:hypothetical protein
MISFCSHVEFVFAFRFASSLCKNSPFVSIRKFVNSAFHRSGEIDLQKTRTKSKDEHAYIMSKFENVLKAQKVKTTFFARFVVIILLLSRGFSSPPPSFCSKSARARSVRRVSTHFFFIPRRGTIRFRASLTHALALFSLFNDTRMKKHAQQFYQQQHKHVHLKGTTDMISSVAIPLAMTASAVGMLAMGLKDLATGSNKKPGF